MKNITIARNLFAPLMIGVSVFLSLGACDLSPKALIGQNDDRSPYVSYSRAYDRYQSYTMVRKIMRNPEASPSSKPTYPTPLPSASASAVPIAPVPLPNPSASASAVPIAPVPLPNPSASASAVPIGPVPLPSPSASPFAEYDEDLSFLDLFSISDEAELSASDSAHPFHKINLFTKASNGGADFRYYVWVSKFANGVRPQIKELILVPSNRDFKKDLSDSDELWLAHPDQDTLSCEYLGEEGSSTNPDAPSSKWVCKSGGGKNYNQNNDKYDYPVVVGRFSLENPDTGDLMVFALKKSEYVTDNERNEMERFEFASVRNRLP